MADASLRIGQIAARAGVSPDLIRHYERVGLLPPPARTSGGYRTYPAAVVERVQLIRNAVRVGFSLRDLAAFFRTRHAGGAPCRQVRAAAEQILQKVDQQIADLKSSRQTLRTMLREWDVRLAQTPHNQPARLLDSLSPHDEGRAVAPRSHLKRSR